MKLKICVNKVKSINHLEMEFPVDKGLYAITGQNGSGKSTLVTCASSVFFSMRMKDYFGTTEPDAYITSEFAGATRSWRKNLNGNWAQDANGVMDLKGFYEGSLIFGNRFKNTSYEVLRQLDRIDGARLSVADDFIRNNLGGILHNNPEFYEKLLRVNSKEAGPDFTFRGEIFYYEKGGRRVSQFHMSTGENLLVSVLHSLHLRNMDRASLNKPCIMFLDEIELALHPSSLKRLVGFLKEMANEFNYAIYFSTHSIELIGSIQPQNIFFLERHSDGSLEVLNPCYPAYATRILYDHSGYDHVFLVEDDLAKEVINRLLRRHSLLSSKLVHILPCGGYTNVIELAREVVNSNLVGRIATVSVILDGDVQREAEAYMLKHSIKNNIPLSFLPIESLEKYLKAKLFDNVDHKLLRKLNDFLFHQVSLTELIETYRSSGGSAKDTGGKRLYKIIEEELQRRKKSRADLVEMIVDHLVEFEIEEMNRIAAYLKGRLS
ncbi:ATP-dependent nuclease [Ideonella oryzae]|nr:AAA family ATPase [Ideonella oryzae]